MVAVTGQISQIPLSLYFAAIAAVFAYLGWIREVNPTGIEHRKDMESSLRGQKYINGDYEFHAHGFEVNETVLYKILRSLIPIWFLYSVETKIELDFLDCAAPTEEQLSGSQFPHVDYSYENDDTAFLTITGGTVADVDSKLRAFGEWLS